MSLNLYLISRNGPFEYDMYDDAVVAAKNETEARNIHPRGIQEKDDPIFSTWVKPDLVTVKLIGVAAENIEAGVICASFNAG